VGGPFRTFHLGGGPGGLPDFLQHLGPALESLWQQLGSPSLNAPTVELLVRQAQEAFGGRPVDALAAERDSEQIAVLKALGKIPAADG
jgi:ketoreductase RED1